MKKKSLSKRKIGLCVSGLLSGILFLILFITVGKIENAQTSQQMAKRWGDSGVTQISCFLSEGTEVTEESLEQFGHDFDQALVEASIDVTSENPGARLWVGAYSAPGKISLASNRTSLTVDALGVGGDFFLFHPLEILHGSYFSGNDLMQDHCILDEDAAWQLFGSNDVAGMMVTIQGVPHIVSGVVKRPQGRLEKAAGLDHTLIYVSYETLSKYGQNYGLNHYEMVCPNPIKDFAIQKVGELFPVDEQNREMLENSARFSLLSRLKVLAGFGTRSMNGKAIIYPYWENIARGYEDILALLTLFMIVFLLYPLVLLLVAIVFWWRHRGWKFRDIRMAVGNWIDFFVEKRRMQNRKKKGAGSLPEEGEVYEEE